MGIRQFPTEEYLCGFRRYIAKRSSAGRPRKDEQRVFYLDSPQILRELPPIGAKILIYETIIKNPEVGATEPTLLDRYETDCYGHPIVFKVVEITNGKIHMEQVINTFNSTYTCTRYIPCIWITCGHMGWITPSDFYKKLKEGKET